jgi:hydrogenase maturation protease
MTERPAPRTLLLGVGNILLSDEGVGVRVLERLVTAYDLPDEVLALDGGTLGLDLLHYLEGVQNLLIIDAVDMGKEPGSVIRLEGDEVPAFMSLKISPHQAGIPDLLFAAKLRDICPPNVVLWGVQPDSLEPGLDLSPHIEARVDELVGEVLDQLARWGSPLPPPKMQASRTASRTSLTDQRFVGKDTG